MLPILFGICIFVLVLVYMAITKTTSKYAQIERFPNEYFYSDPLTNKKEKLPSLFDPPTKSLSVIVPAYNEEARLPVMLKECLEYLEMRTKSDNAFSFEILIVDDGSSDNTTKVSLQYSLKYGCDKIRVLTLVKNRGKGGAVRLGVLSSRGRNILFADADGATCFPDIEKLESSLKSFQDSLQNGKCESIIICGSRAHLEQEAIATRSFLRNLLMHGFHALVWFFAVRTVRDTQCGFKLFTRKAAQETFPSIHIERWAFDVELLFLAEKMNIPIGEVAVKWTEIEGSKVVPVLSWIQMGRDLFLIWLRYTIGAWAPKKK
ncbi:dolichyl-phosphate beta-glucosyltransferase-like isoform X2 [Artemia franciscana]|uniref:Dolichyl-phosphate beta-glucosyltransferase n=2 Tax=Artemia franciscana TaxID=6661 RepID=A0AA88HZN3_ARTSF|nr:hypothetical protein QYM36_004176 [Artemia franciscana]KAK2720189.1 hypothetical protein QYM36_004176 [Artemia franciscana]